MRTRWTPTTIAARLAQGFRLPHEAASIDACVHAVLVAAPGDPAAHDPARDTLLVRYLEAVRDAGLQDVCRTQATYARTLAASSGLLDEERVKVLSLCDEVEALEELGLPFSAEEREAFVTEMTRLLTVDRGRYATLARARAQSPRRGLWHMRLLLD